jgi:hypothetical protein
MIVITTNEVANKYIFYTNQKRLEVIVCLNMLPKNAFSCFVLSQAVIFLL